MLARVQSAFTHFKRKWGVGNWGVVAILLAFSLAGMSCLKVSRPIMHALVPADAPKWVFWSVRIPVIVPVYEVLLLAFGTVLGQRQFFWPKQKRILRFLARPFLGRA
jgi:hypothetical protein